MTDLFKTAGAVVSDCYTYRYSLFRRWSVGPVCGFVMLNPSTADAETDDPTIRRCISFAMREGCGALEVFNLFAFRATEPEDMAQAVDPVGPENDRHIVDGLARVDGPIICAWGAHWMARERADQVLAIIGSRARCLGLTKRGMPRHPLYVKGDAPLVLFSGAKP